MAASSSSCKGRLGMQNSIERLEHLGDWRHYLATSMSCLSSRLWGCTKLIWFLAHIWSWLTTFTTRGVSTFNSLPVFSERLLKVCDAHCVFDAPLFFLTISNLFFVLQSLRLASCTPLSSLSGTSWCLPWVQNFDQQKKLRHTWSDYVKNPNKDGKIKCLRDWGDSTLTDDCERTRDHPCKKTHVPGFQNTWRTQSLSPQMSIHHRITFPSNEQNTYPTVSSSAASTVKSTHCGASISSCIKLSQSGPPHPKKKKKEQQQQFLAYATQ